MQRHYWVESRRGMVINTNRSLRDKTILLTTEITRQFLWSEEDRDENQALLP